ncbi:gamma-secretase subunit APH-1A isoform X2 [Malurus melanocephalus]|uniref:gamma-secretase subunit APH-1A isoform X2 n=1 Tax=Malurus melanocephalus TaxID=175006 RepID=UPI002547B0C4|nr:gamma-secretase subunit APH-1A isoform X2 [Malurus melanocephalus]
MAAAVFWGCAAIAFGPAAALLLLTVAAEPLRLIVLVAGAFLWLLALLFASLLWAVSLRLRGTEDAALLPLGAAAAVLLQELCRFGCFKLLSVRALLRHRQRRLLPLQRPGGLCGAGHCRDPRALPVFLHHLRLPHHGPGAPPHLLGRHLLPRVRAAAPRGPGAGAGRPLAHLGAELPEPVVRGQPGSHPHPHALHRPLRLQHRRRLLPQPPPVPLL